MLTTARTNPIRPSVRDPRSFERSHNDSQFQAFDTVEGVDTIDLKVKLRRHLAPTPPDLSPEASLWCLRTGRSPESRRPGAYRS